MTTNTYNLPWWYDPKLGYIYDNNGEYVSKDNGYAQHIVHCVNNHDALVAYLENAIEICEAHGVDMVSAKAALKAARGV